MPFLFYFFFFFVKLVFASVVNLMFLPDEAQDGQTGETRVSSIFMVAWVRGDGLLSPVAIRI